MTETAPATPAGTTVDRPEEEPSIGQLVASASRDVSALVRHEIALAKSELKVSVRMGGMAAGLFAAAAFVVLLAVVLLSVAFGFFVSMTGLHLAWSFLIVVVVYLLVAALLGLLGYRKVRKVRPPERAMAQAQETRKALSRRG